MGAGGSPGSSGSSGSPAPDRRPYSHWERPFRRQMRPFAQEGFPRTAPASAGRCLFPGGCLRFEWRNGAKYCRDHWLQVYHQDRLPL